MSSSSLPHYCNVNMSYGWYYAIVLRKTGERVVMGALFADYLDGAYRHFRFVRFNNNSREFEVAPIDEAYALAALFGQGIVMIHKDPSVPVHQMPPHLFKSVQLYYWCLLVRVAGEKL